MMARELSQRTYPQVGAPDPHHSISHHEDRQEKLEALAGLKPRLLTDVQKLPGARILDGQFTAVQQAIGTAKNREASARFLRAFVEDVKASGIVAEAISRNGAQGVTVAPPAPAQ